MITIAQTLANKPLAQNAKNVDFYPAFAGIFISFVVITFSLLILMAVHFMIAAHLPQTKQTSLSLFLSRCVALLKRTMEMPHACKYTITITRTYQLTIVILYCSFVFLYSAFESKRLFNVQFPKEYLHLPFLHLCTT